MSLGDLQRTRRLAGNPASTNVSDADITQGLLYGTSQVIRITGKTDWETDTLHPDYPSAVMAAEYFASSMVRDRFADQTDISTEHYARANDIIKQIAESLAASGGAGSGGGGGGTNVAVVKRQYRTNPLNPNAPVYRSLISTGQYLVGVQDSTLPLGSN